MPKITLSMIVKNEESYLQGCLESVKDVVDEIIIVDTGSTDSTVKIAKDFDAKVFNFAWINDFSAARNYALSKSTGDWILYLDADERLSSESISEILSFVDRDEKLGLNCIINNLDEVNDSPKLMKYVRFFKNEKKIKFCGKAHEQIEPSLISNNYQLIDSTIEIIHHGYNLDKIGLQIKAKRNLDLMLLDYQANPTSYLSFQIANSYSILEDLENTILFYKEALKDKNLRREFKSICYLHLTDFKIRQHDLSAAKSYVEKGIRIDKNNSLLNMIAAQVYDKINNGHTAVKYCKNAYELNKKTTKTKTSNNVIDILIDNKKILLEGIIISLKFGMEENVKYFLNNLKYEDILYYETIKIIITNNLTSSIEVEKLISFVNNRNLDIVFKLLKFNTNNEYKLDFFSKIYDIYNSNSNYLTNFGEFLMNINQLEEARILFESSIENDNYDETVIFYLASIYTSTNNLPQLINLLEMADIKAESNEFLKSKLILLKSKLQPILNK